ncbi:MAG: DUF4115 domain-containing protein [Elusimicrobia bacterium]|nr:DUF4115 domain-containing protein [Elusimicrobiota bacterium]
MNQTPSAGAAKPAPETPEAAGARLRSVRMERGYSLESVGQHTRIPRKFLEAMEQGRFDDLPAPVYARSYLRSYCDYLELAFEPLWQALQPPAPAAPAAAEPKAAEAPAPERPALPVSPYLEAAASALGALLLSAALAVGLILLLTLGRGRRQPAEETPRPEALAPLQSAAGLTLDVVLRGETWLSVEADGRTVFAGRAPKGARQQWRAQRRIELRAADPDNLILGLNGAPWRLPRPEPDGSYRIELP